MKIDIAIINVGYYIIKTLLHTFCEKQITKLLYGVQTFINNYNLYNN